MNLDKFIRIKLTELSQKYDLSLIEIQTAKEGNISKIYKIIVKAKKDDDEDLKEEFYSKRQLVSWLLCLK